MPITVRPGRLSDEAAMRSVFRAAGRAAWPHILAAKTLANLKMPQRWINVANAGPERSLLIAEDDVRVLGFAVVVPGGEPGAAELDSFYTHPSVWGQGVGRSLMEAAVSFMTLQGYKAAKLWTAEENHRPRRFYEQGGWTLNGEERTREMDGVEFVEVRYELKLGTLTPNPLSLPE